MNDNTPVYNWEDAIKFIHERCNLNKDVIIEVLELLLRKSNKTIMKSKV